MKQKMRIIALVLTFVMCMCSFAFAGIKPLVNVIKDTGNVTLQGTSAANADVNIVIEKEHKMYFVDAVKADENGNYQFSTVLPKGMKFDSTIVSKIDGSEKELHKVEIVTPENAGNTDKPGGDGDITQPTEKSKVKISIDKKTIKKGYVLEPIEVEIKSGESVWDVTKRVMESRNIKYRTSFSAKYNSVYVESIDGDGEFDHGSGSGWMINVDGIYPDRGCSVIKLYGGETIQWRYTTKLGKDLGNAASGAVAGGATENTKEPVIGESDIPLVSSDKSIKKLVSSKAEVNTKPDSNGSVKAKLSEKDISEAIDKVIKLKEDKTEDTKSRLILKVSVDGKAKTVETTIPKEALLKISEKVDIVTVASPLANFNIKKEVLQGIIKDAKGDLKIKTEIVLTKDINNLNEESKSIIGDKPVFDFTAFVGENKVSNFKNEIEVTTFYNLAKNEEKEGVVVYYINDGKLELIKNGSYDSSTGIVHFKTNHFSKYVACYRGISFDDTKNHWAKNNVTYLAAREIIKGVNDKYFAPDSNITRAEFVAILARMSDDKLPQKVEKFNDVNPNAWYSQSVIWAVNNGIAKGVSKEKFAPNANISRQDMAVMLENYIKYKNINLEKVNQKANFTDKEKISVYAKNSVMEMQQAGVINGVKVFGDIYSFKPKNNATRAEASKMISIILQNSL